VAHRSTIFPFAKRHRTNPWNSIFTPDVASVAVHELRAITLSPSAIMSSIVTWRSGQRSGTLTPNDAALLRLGFRYPETCVHTLLQFLRTPCPPGFHSDPEFGISR